MRGREGERGGEGWGVTVKCGCVMSALPNLSFPPPVSLSPLIHFLSSLPLSIPSRLRFLFLLLSSPFPSLPLFILLSLSPLPRSHCSLLSLLTISLLLHKLFILSSAFHFLLFPSYSFFLFFLLRFRLISSSSYLPPLTLSIIAAIPLFHFLFSYSSFSFIHFIGHFPFLIPFFSFLSSLFPFLSSALHIFSYFNYSSFLSVSSSSLTFIPSSLLLLLFLCIRFLHSPLLVSWVFLFISSSSLFSHSTIFFPLFSFSLPSPLHPLFFFPPFFQVTYSFPSSSPSICLLSPFIPIPCFSSSFYFSFFFSCNYSIKLFASIYVPFFIIIILLLFIIFLFFPLMLSPFIPIIFYFL